MELDLRHAIWRGPVPSKRPWATSSRKRSRRAIWITCRSASPRCGQLPVDTVRSDALGPMVRRAGAISRDRGEVVGPL